MRAWRRTYVSTAKTSLKDLVKRTGRPDLIVDATGSSRLAFEAMQHLGLNGVLVWTGITGGDKKVEVPTDNINLQWVLGNKLLLGSVNANRTHFEMGIKDLALGEMMFPGVLQKILTHPVDWTRRLRRNDAASGRGQGCPQGLRQRGQRVGRESTSK